MLALVGYRSCVCGVRHLIHNRASHVAAWTRPLSASGAPYILLNGNKRPPLLNSTVGQRHFAVASPRVVFAINKFDFLSRVKVPCRLQSNSSTGASEFLLDCAEDGVENVAKVLEEVSLSSLGLASVYTPAGWIQKLLETLHIDFGLPWWGAIALLTVCMRLCTFPLMIHMRRNSVHMLNNMKEQKIIMDNLNHEAQQNNAEGMIRALRRLNEFQANASPFQFFPWSMFANGCVISSMYLALRGMTYAPVDSLRHGGTAWFVDLLQGDPYYLLPSLGLVSTYGILFSGAETGVSLRSMSKGFRYLMLGLPVTVFLFVANWPASILFYLFCQNMISTSLALLLRIPTIKSLLQLPNVEDLPNFYQKDEKEKFFETFKQSEQH